MAVDHAFQFGGPAMESAQRTPVGVIMAVGVLAAAMLSIAFGSLLQRKQPR